MIAQSRNETLLLLAAGIALCLELAVLFIQMRWVPISVPWLTDERKGASIGKVVQRQNNVNLRALDSLTWYPVVDGDGIRQGDTLMTGPSSTARVILESQGELILEPDTLIRFSESGTNEQQEELRLVVNQGRVQVKSRKVKVRVKLRKRELAVAPNSDVVVAKAPLREEEKVEVRSGNAEVSEGKAKPIKLERGETVNLIREEKMEKAAPFSISEMRPLSGTRKLTDKVVFQWKGGGEVLEIDRSAQFSAPKRVPITQLPLEMDLPSGEYFWRVRKGPQFSGVQRFEILRPGRPQLVSPPQDTRYRQKDKILLEWEPVKEAQSYRLEISATEDFSKKFYDQLLKENHLALSKAKPGQYFWRVTAQSETWGSWPTTSSRSFTVKAPLAAPKIKGAKVRKKGTRLPADKGSYIPSSRWSPLANLFRKVWNVLVPSAHAETRNVREEGKRKTAVWTFQWEPIPRAVKYRLEVSQSNSFKKLIWAREVSQAGHRVELPLEKQYYWRVAGIDRDGDRGAFSEIQRIDTPDTFFAVAKPKPQPKPAVKEEPPPPPKAEGARWLLPSWVRVGATGTYVSENLKTTSYEVTQSGLPLNRFFGSLHRSFSRSEVELTGWYQDLRFTSEDAAISDFQKSVREPVYGANLYWKGAFYLGGLPWTLGVFGTRRVQSRQLAPETVDIVGLTYGGLVLGVSWSRLVEGGFYWQNDLLLEGSPIGKVVGASLVARSRFGFWRQKPFAPEFELQVRPFYLKVPSQNEQFTGFHVSASLVLGGLFDSTPDWSAP